MDISHHDKTAVRLFKLILTDGPITLYKATSESDIPIGTIHRHFKEMEEGKKIRIYLHSSDGRKKIAYGPTLYGFVYFFRIDNELANKLEDYFDFWIRKNQFASDLVDAGFDTKSITSDQKTKKIFRKYIQYYSGVEDQLINFSKNLEEIPHETRLFIGEFLLSTKKEYKKTWEELYSSLPGFRKNVLEFFESMMRVYSDLKRKS